MRGFRPIKVRAITGVKDKTTYLTTHSIVTAWEKVLDIYNGIGNYGDRINVSNLHPERTTVKGQYVYHKSMAEVVEKYHDPFNAFLITQDSWVDKKLQEVYNSKRTVAKGNGSDGSNTT